MATNIVSFALAIVCLELIWPIALAVICVALQVKVPLPVERFATLLAAAAGPCALFAIGLFVSQLSIRAGLRASWPTTTLKLALHPLLMAQRYRLLEAETSTGAVLSTAASVVTVSAVMIMLAAR